MHLPNEQLSESSPRDAPTPLTILGTLAVFVFAAEQSGVSYIDLGGGGVYATYGSPPEHSLPRGM